MSNDAASYPEGKVWDHPAAGLMATDYRNTSECPAVLRELNPVTKQPRDKIAVVGFAQHTYKLAPFDDPEWSIWGLNQLYRHIPRADRWFEMHEYTYHECVEGTDHVGWINTCPIPVYMCKARPEARSVIPYPLKAVSEFFGQAYFTSTIAYMVALAIVHRPKEIAIYGVDLVVGVEYVMQRPCLEFYLGYARALGITVTIPKQSALLKQLELYGYTPPSNLVNLAEFHTRSEALKKQKYDFEVKGTLLEGARQEALYWMTQLPHEQDAILKRYEQLVQKKAECDKSAIFLEGARQETENWGTFVGARLGGAEASVPEDVMMGTP